MQSRTPVEIADRYSRKRTALVAAAAIVFVVGQLLGGPFFGSGPETAPHLTRGVVWTVNVIVLLLLLATGGGLLNDRQIRALVNDEISRKNYRTSVVAGFWIAMTTAMVLYIVPAFNHFTGREAVYIVVTASVAVASLAFAYLEHRAHRDA